MKTNKEIIEEVKNFDIGTCKVYSYFYPSVNLNITKYNDGIGLHYYNDLGKLVDLGMVQLENLEWKLDKLKSGDL